MTQMRMRATTIDVTVKADNFAFDILIYNKKVKSVKRCRV